uniref:Uncharacterized protein n=1 Tax=Arundo donax TaxID=35708 RepID=A0A0A9EYX7_ARUDO
MVQMTLMERVQDSLLLLKRKEGLQRQVMKGIQLRSLMLRRRWSMDKRHLAIQQVLLWREAMVGLIFLGGRSLRAWFVEVCQWLLEERYGKHLWVLVLGKLVDITTNCLMKGLQNQMRRTSRTLC